MKPRIRWEWHHKQWMARTGGGFIATIRESPGYAEVTIIDQFCLEQTQRATFERATGWRQFWNLIRRSAVLALLLSLAGCGQAPVKVERTPDVCPAPPATPAQAHVALPEFLPLLDETKALAKDPHVASGEILRVRVDSAAQYQACRANNDALEKWVISHSQQE
jgi:hypothetical protein